MMVWKGTTTKGETKFINELGPPNLENLVVVISLFYL